MCLPQLTELRLWDSERAMLHQSEQSQVTLAALPGIAHARASQFVLDLVQGLRPLF